MKQSKHHLDINLDFLDKKESFQDVPKSESRTRQTSRTPKSSLLNRRYNGKNILIIGGVILFFGSLVFSDYSSSSSSYAPSTSSSNSSYSNNDDMVRVGEYMCSRYHYNRATELEPDESSLIFEKNLLISRSDEVDRLTNEIEDSYVNEYSAQWEIDEYNTKIDEHNQKLGSYNRDAAGIESKIDRHNDRVEIYNNYLIQNCTLNR